MKREHSSPGLAFAIVMAVAVSMAACDNRMSSTGSPTTPSAAGAPASSAAFSGQISSIDTASQMVNVGSTSVHVSSATVIHGKSNAALHFNDLKVGEHAQVKGVADNERVEAEEIDVDDAVENPEPQPPENNEAEVTGVVGSLVAGTSCSNQNLAFVLNGGARVNTNASTRFDDGSCASVVAGVRVEVKGTQGAGGAIAASRVKLEDD